MKRPHPRKMKVGVRVVKMGNWGVWYRRRSRFEPWCLYRAIWLPDYPEGAHNPYIQGGGFVPKRPQAASGGEGGRDAAKRTGQLQKFPLLADHLLSLRYDDGDELRLPGYLIVRPQAGAWHVTLKDPSTGLQLRVATETLDLAWGALEALLGSTSCPWEIDQYAKPQKKRKG